MGLSPVKRESISEQVFAQMKQMILDREWYPGERLPSEAELGTIFGVSRVTIRQALQKLAVLGLIETRTGEGSFVREADFSQTVKNAIYPPAYLQTHNIQEVLEFRSAVEVETAALAARRATEKDVRRLRELLDSQYNRKLRTPKSFADDDMEFHMVIARSTGNGLIVAVYEILREVLSDAMVQTVQTLGFDVGLPYHQQLIDAIEARDERGAIKAMKAHMDTTRAQFILQGDPAEREAPPSKNKEPRQEEDSGYEST